jgi:hypothetical protein
LKGASAKRILFLIGIIYNYQNSRYYLSFCLLFNIQPNSIGLSAPHRLMPSIGVSRWHINITNTILDVIHRPVFYFKHSVSESRFCLRLQMEPTQLGLILEVVSLSVGSTWRWKQNPVFETLYFK